MRRPARLAALLGAAALLAACRVVGELRPPRDAPSASTQESVVLQPASKLALALADLPAGFRIGEELTPRIEPAGAQDPWGRLSSYSVTFLPAFGEGSGPTLGDVVSSVNAYSDPDHARHAFQSWRDAVPATYRLRDGPPPRLGQDALVFVQPAAPARRQTCLIGFRARNVMASVWVSAPEAPEAAGVAPVETALRLARLVDKRISGGR
jgi:hypothetical protein